MSGGVMVRAVAVALGVAAFAAAGPVEAAVFSVVTNRLLTAFPFAVTFGSPNVSYAFTAADTGGNGPGAAVMTGGTAQASYFFGGLTDFGAGATIDQTNEIYTFAAFPTATLIPNSAADDFIGLAFTLADGVHYGYAEVAGPQLVSYGFETTPRASILTGATPTMVPEPASLALLGVSVLGFGALRRRRGGT